MSVAGKSVARKSFACIGRRRIARCCRFVTHRAEICSGAPSCSAVASAMLWIQREVSFRAGAAQISKPHAAMDRHGGRVRPRAASLAERNRRRSRHGGGGVRLRASLFVICHGSGDASADSQNVPDTPRPATPCLLCTLTSAPCAILPVDHSIATIDVVAASIMVARTRAASSNLIPPPADTNAARRHALPFSADPRDRGLIGWMRPTE